MGRIVALLDKNVEKFNLGDPVNQLYFFLSHNHLTDIIKSFIDVYIDAY